MPGAYQGWDPTTADSLVSATGDGVYKGVILFNAKGVMLIVFTLV